MVSVGGADTLIADMELEDAMEARGDLGCGLDNEIAFYTGELDDMERLMEADDLEGLVSYMKGNGIFYYVLDTNGNLQGGGLD